MIYRKRLFVCLLLLLLFMCRVAAAGQFKVTPIGLFFDDGVMTETLKVTNLDAAPITVQLSAYDWQQDDQGKDIYTPSDDIIFFPKIIKIEPSKEQIIRVGIQGETKALDQERSYRVFIDELPIAAPGEMVMQFTLSMSIPVFIKADREHKQVLLEQVAVKHSQVVATIRNLGNTHVKVQTLKAATLDAAGAIAHETEIKGWYLLAGQKHSYELSLPEQACRAARQLQVTATVDEKEYQVDIPAAPTACTSLEAKPEKIRGK